MSGNLKKNLAFVLGATPNVAFAAGSLLLGLERHMRGHDHDVLLIHEGIDGPDARLLEALGARLVPYQPLHLRREALPENHPAYYLYIFECFRLLDEYKTVIWLDCDMAVQGDLSALAQYGPFAMAVTDSSFLRDGITYTFGRNFYKPELLREEDYDTGAPFANSGVLVLQNPLPRPLKLYEWCIRTFEEHRSNLRHTDQAVLNMLALKFPDLYATFQAGEFNCYPLNPASLNAKIVHCFGARKFWNDGLMRLAFPEWHRDYLNWLDLGGSRFEGEITDRPLIRRGTYPLLCSLVEKLNSLLEK